MWLRRVRSGRSPGASKNFTSVILFETSLFSPRVSLKKRGVLNKPRDELRLIDSPPWFAAPSQRDCGAVLTVIKTLEHLPDDVATLQEAL